jgi:hypothetical protein
MRLKVLLVAIALCTTGCKGCGSAPAPPPADEVSPIPISTQPSVAIDARGRAVVGWYTGVVGSNNVAHARRLEKGTWTELGGLGDPREHNGPVDVAIGANDKPVAAWCAGKVPSVVRVAAWNGKAWDELAGADNRLGRALLPSVAASADGRVAVAWFDEVGVAELGVRQWISGAWSTLPSPVRGPDLAHTLGWPSIALDASGAVHRGALRFAVIHGDATPSGLRGNHRSRSSAGAGPYAAKICSAIRRARTKRSELRTLEASTRVSS